MPHEGRRLDDVEVVLVGQRREAVIGDEGARRVHRRAVLGERLDERRGVVVLDDVEHLGRPTPPGSISATQGVARRLLG